MKEMISKTAEKVRDAIIAHDSFNKKWQVNIFEDGSVVTLTGTVPSKTDAELIESIASDQEGVMSVNNELNVNESLLSMPDDDEIDPTFHHIQIASQTN